MIGFVLTSRNNYEFMDKVWAENVQPTCPVLSIDEDSSPDQVKLGKKICGKRNIKFIKREDPGMHSNILTACNYFKNMGCKFIVWFQHDCWPYNVESFVKHLTRLSNKDAFANFGAVGFNALATDVCKNYRSQIKQLRRGAKPIGILARSSLEVGGPWYSGYASKKIEAIPSEKYTKPFAVESPAWFAAGVWIDQYLEHIVPDKNFRFFGAWDDISFQFLNKNIYNIALPDVYIIHRPDLKAKYDLPVRSVRHKDTSTLYGKNDHGEVWKKKWGWDRVLRLSYRAVRDRYKETLIDEFFRHDRSKGPLKVFQI